jgi:alpha-L-fucosidase 2
MKNRRRFLACTGLALALPGLAPAKVLATERAGREELSLWYEQPAGPRLGAAAFTGTA